MKSAAEGRQGDSIQPQVLLLRGVLHGRQGSERRLQSPRGLGLLSLEVPIGKSNAVLVLGTPIGESILLEYGAVGLRLSRLPAVVFIGF